MMFILSLLATIALAATAWIHGRSADSKDDSLSITSAFMDATIVVATLILFIWIPAPSEQGLAVLISAAAWVSITFFVARRVFRRVDALMSTDVFRTVALDAVAGVGAVLVGLAGAAAFLVSVFTIVSFITPSYPETTTFVVLLIAALFGAQHLDKARVQRNASIATA